MMGKGAEQFQKSRTRIVNPNILDSTQMGCTSESEESRTETNQPNAMNNHHYPNIIG